MPELPEVETTRRGIAPYLEGQTVSQVIIRQPQLRWPIPIDLNERLSGQCLQHIERRGKYLLLHTADGSAIVHLGMSGSLRITDSQDQTPGKHDHVDLVLVNQTVLRFNDPRRFGAWLWSAEPYRHPLLATLGPEPLSDGFDADYLLQRAKNRTIPVKNLIMDSHVVVGVGNIYASEALFSAQILPTRSAKNLSPSDCQQLVAAIRQVLTQAIQQGGTTLRDFRNAQGKPGYFQQALNVYGRLGQACHRCNGTVSQLKIGQRASYFCTDCQH